MSKIPMPEAPEGYGWIKTTDYPYDHKLIWEGQNYSLVSKLKTYDWSKTADYVLVTSKGSGWGLLRKEHCAPLDIASVEIAKEWLPHFGGRCPFDEEASIVEVEFRKTGLRESARGSEYNFKQTFFVESVNRRLPVISAVRFIKLVDGYTWGNV